MRTQCERSQRPKTFEFQEEHYANSNLTRDAQEARAPGAASKQCDSLKNVQYLDFNLTSEQACAVHRL
jgi:hypothetical protein